MEYLSRIKNIKLWPYRVFAIDAGAFIAGILAGNLYMFDWPKVWPILLLMVLGLMLAALLNLLLQNHLIVLISWLLIWLVLGVATVSYRSNHICLAEPNSISGMVGVVAADPQLDDAGQQLVVEGNIQSCNGVKVLVKAPRFPVLAYGDRIEVTGQIQKPGIIDGFDYGGYLRAKYISYVILSPSKIETLGRNQNFSGLATRTLYKIKNRFEDSLNRIMPEPEASLGVGLITGAKRSLSSQLKDSLSATGLSHIIALSGYNITIIILALSALLRGSVSRKGIFWIGGGLVVLFIIMTGASASVVRAGIFSLLIIYGQTIGRKAHQGNIILLTAAIMLFLNPFLLLNDLGFQLSFLAFLGIVYLGEPLAWLFANAKLKWLPNWLKLPLIETLSAQILVFPLIAFAFGRISLISPLANLLVLWILPLAMLMSFLSGLAGIAWLGLGKIVAWLTWPVLAYIIQISFWLSKLQFASVATEKYNRLLIVLLYSVLVVSYYFLLSRAKKCRRLSQK